MSVDSSDLEHNRSRLEASQPTDRVSYREREDTLEAIDALVDDGVYPNRSAAIRAATQDLVSEDGGSDG